MKFSEIVVDVKAEEEGAWQDHPRFRGVQVLVRSTHSREYKRVQRVLVDSFPVKRLKRSDIAKQSEYVHRYSLPALCIGWRGIEDAEYSESTAKEWVESDEMYAKTRIFWEGVYELAEAVGELDREEHQAVLGN